MRKMNKLLSLSFILILSLCLTACAVKITSKETPVPKIELSEDVTSTIPLTEESTVMESETLTSNTEESTVIESETLTSYEEESTADSDTLIHEQDKNAVDAFFDNEVGDSTALLMTREFSSLYDAYKSNATDMFPEAIPINVEEDRYTDYEEGTDDAYTYVERWLLYYASETSYDRGINVLRHDLSNICSFEYSRSEDFLSLYKDDKTDSVWILDCDSASDKSKRYYEDIVVTILYFKSNTITGEMSANDLNNVLDNAKRYSYRFWMPSELCIVSTTANSDTTYTVDKFINEHDLFYDDEDKVFNYIFDTKIGDDSGLQVSEQLHSIFNKEYGYFEASTDERIAKNYERTFFEFYDEQDYEDGLHEMKSLLCSVSDFYCEVGDTGLILYVNEDDGIAWLLDYQQDEYCEYRKRFMRKVWIICMCNRNLDISSSNLDFIDFINTMWDNAYGNWLTLYAK